MHSADRLSIFVYLHCRVSRVLKPFSILSFDICTTSTIFFSSQLQGKMQAVSETSSHSWILTGPVNEDFWDPKERSCCICYQPFGSTSSPQSGSEVPIQLSCGHVFGRTCILSWTLTNNSCPLCRRDVFGISDEPTHRHLSAPQTSLADDFITTEQDDIWLDRHVWQNFVDDELEDTVSISDIETLIEFYPSEHPNAYFDFQSPTSLDALVCAKDRGFCQHSGDEDAISVDPHESLPGQTKVQIRYTDIDTFDFSEIGAQFAELKYCYRQCMDGHLNEPNFGEETVVY
jgi:hypothetical protein